MGGASAYIDHSDAVGSTTMETDPAGAVQWDVTHYPWGRVFQEQGIRQSEVVMGLDWQVNDPVIPSATREFSFRDYRWMTPDPDNAGAHVGDSQSWDMYSYVGDNPTTNTDPSGLDCIHFSPSPGGITVGVESGSCSGSGGVPVNGTVDVNSFTYKGGDLGYSYTPYSGAVGTGVIGFGAPASTSDLPPFALEALPLVGSWASTGIKNAAVNMGINGALAGAGVLVGAGMDWLAASREASSSGNVVEATVHGAKRLADASRLDPVKAIEAELRATMRYTQADGARVFVQEISPGRFNVVVKNPATNRIITVLKSVDRRALDNLARNFGWR